MTRLWFFWTAVVLHIVLHVSPSEAQDQGKPCMDRFSNGKEDFVLNTDESVKEGATFLSSPRVTRAEDCVQACCNDPNCNLALMEHGQDPKSITSCFIFNCLYKQTKVCRFVRKKGFSNYLLKPVFKDYLEQKVSDVEDKPPVAVAGQDRVVQPQEDVTLNGIESKDDKEIVKYEWVQVSGDTSAVVKKGLFKDSVTVSNLSPGMYKFRLTVTDDAGQTGSTEVSVLVLTPEQSLHHCLVPKKEGPCRGSFPRWHYNAATEKCEEFKYGGCKANRNNYLALNECENACDKVSVKKKFSRLLDIPVDTSKAHCVEPPVTGSCRESATHWYYNPYERRCNRFNYGGCGGNMNRFKTEEECKSTCSSVTESDVFAARGQFEKQEGSNDTAAIAFAVVLGFAIAILLVVIACCLVKGRKKRQNKHQAVNGGHVHTYVDSEKLVYNSTTKPV
ncbi:unnamed protein product [Leuciscus chuanchicus]